MNTKQILEKAITTFGSEFQQLILIEEISELTKALIKYKRDPSNQNYENIAEETADVEIMLEQLKLIYKNYELVSNYKKEKVKRLQNRLILKELQK